MLPLPPSSHLTATSMPITINLQTKIRDVLYIDCVKNRVDPGSHYFLFSILRVFCLLLFSAALWVKHTQHTTPNGQIWAHSKLQCCPVMPYGMAVSVPLWSSCQSLIICLQASYMVLHSNISNTTVHDRQHI